MSASPQLPSYQMGASSPEKSARSPSPRKTPRGSRRSFNSNGSLRKALSLEEFDPSQVIVSTVHPDLIPAALEYENFSYLQILVEEDKVPVVGYDDFGNHAVHAVAVKGGGPKAFKVIDYLLQQGLAPFLHTRNIHGLSPVMAAAEMHKWDTMQYLIGIGADVVAEKDGESTWDSCQPFLDGKNAFHEGLEQQLQAKIEGKLVTELPKHKPKVINNQFSKACQAGDLAYVQYIIDEFGVDVNHQNSAGSTVLHLIAGDSKRLPLVAFLVDEQHIDIHIVNNVGDDATLVAARARAWPVMQFLISRGASVSFRDKKSDKCVYDHSKINEQGRIAYEDGIAEKRARNEAAQAAQAASAPRTEAEAKVQEVAPPNDEDRPVKGCFGCGK